MTGQVIKFSEMNTLVQEGLEFHNSPNKNMRGYLQETKEIRHTLDYPNGSISRIVKTEP